MAKSSDLTGSLREYARFIIITGDADGTPDTTSIRKAIEATADGIASACQDLTHADAESIGGHMAAHLREIITERQRNDG